MFLWGACEILAPQSGIKPVPPALEGGFIITGPPGKSSRVTISNINKFFRQF